MNVVIKYFGYSVVSKETERVFTSDDVKRIRKSTGLTQKEFSETFRINLNTIKHWEKGDRSPNGSSIVLLDLIEKSGTEISSILKLGVRGKVIKSPGKEFLQEAFYNRKYQNFEELVNSNDDYLKDAVLALLSANGFLFKEVKDNDCELCFFVGHVSSSLKCVLTIDKESKSVSGELKELIEKTYLTLFAIEKDMRDAIYWSPDIRKKRIAKLIQDLEIDTEFYSHILKNW
jgi:DNA-binding transcriptional regulator YiaG